jgi:hypothetical protein
MLKGLAKKNSAAASISRGLRELQKKQRRGVSRARKRLNKKMSGMKLVGRRTGRLIKK